MPPTLCLNGPISIGGCVGLERLVASFLLPRAAPGNCFAAKPFSVSFRCFGKRCAADMRSRRYGEWEGTLLFPKHIPIRSERTNMPISDRDLGKRCAADMRSRRYGEWEGTLLFPKHIPIRSERTNMPISDRDLGRVR